MRLVGFVKYVPRSSAAMQRVIPTFCQKDPTLAWEASRNNFIFFRRNLRAKSFKMRQVIFGRGLVRICVFVHFVPFSSKASQAFNLEFYSSWLRNREEYHPVN
jgi:hypothetical protein